MSTASTDDVATDCLTDDDEVPPMLPLERCITLTRYNDFSADEWPISAIMTPCFGNFQCEVPPPPSFPPPLTAASSADVQVALKEEDLPAPSFAPSLDTNQRFGQWDYMFAERNQYQLPLQAEHKTWPSSNGFGGDSENCPFAPTSEKDFGTWATTNDCQSVVNQDFQYESCHQIDPTAWATFGPCQSTSNLPDQFQASCGGAWFRALESDTYSSKLLAGGEERAQALEAMKGQIARLAFDKSGCRDVQAAIQVAGKDVVGSIVAELHGCVFPAVKSPYANYVIQKIVETLPPSLNSFVATELRGGAATVARHRYGCRILSRIFEHSAEELSSKELANELLADAAGLSKHVFAHHVIETILEHGLPEQRQRLAESLMPYFWHNAEDRYSSYVVASAMKLCAEPERNALMALVAEGSSERLVLLLRGQSGNRVLKAIAKLPGHSSKNALRAIVGKLRSLESAFAGNHHAQRLLQELSVAGQAAVEV